jgi:hypothetical protein
MSMKTLAARNTAATTEAQTTERVLDLDTTRAVAIDGATLIECDAYERTPDGHALRYDGAAPLFVVGIYSARDARHALAEAGYDHAAIERAFDEGEWMERNHKANATEAVAAAESEVVADGGQQTCEWEYTADCAGCMFSRTAYESGPAHAAKDRHEADCDGHTVAVRVDEGVDIHNGTIPTDEEQKAELGGGR